MRLFLTLLAGLLFGAGIAISGMINPAKVLNFFDVAGSFDPSLAFVMGGGVVTAMLGYRLLFSCRSQPLFDTSFHLPTAKHIDLPLVAGSALFGVGWGLAGFCPGGAIPALGLGDMRTVGFVASLLVGLLLAKAIRQRQHSVARV